VVRYTNYILNGNPLQPDNFIAEGRLRLTTTIVVLPSAIIGVVFVGCMIPACVAIDSGRLLKLRYYQYCKAQRRERYLKSVMISLGHNKNEWIILKAA
jgi:hypothetical protein